jgi:hypothetical protein
MRSACFYYESKAIGVESGKKLDSGTYDEKNAAVGINLDELIYGGKIY